ncbi:hypothetical protein [Alkalihalobacterium bogoriense]|uniref:hypothetical protein n=1 Tax=Alkalihalobacterium bogoriense TaxID=246272 RepID=UPI0006891A86|nr:hypothetical protein [Alkalihalobacterium bogoriense]
MNNIDITNYKNFEEAASDLLDLINTFMTDKLVTITRITNETFTVLKVLDNNTGCGIHEGFTINVNDTL